MKPLSAPWLIAESNITLSFSFLHFILESIPYHIWLFLLKTLFKGAICNFLLKWILFVLPVCEGVVITHHNDPHVGFYLWRPVFLFLCEVSGLDFMQNPLDVTCISIFTVYIYIYIYISHCKSGLLAKYNGSNWKSVFPKRNWKCNFMTLQSWTNLHTWCN